MVTPFLTRRAGVGILALLPIAVSAAAPADASPAHTESLAHEMTRMTLQIAVILFATWIGGRLIRKIKLPEVIGQILAGMVVGPFALGGIPLPGLHAGLFPVAEGAVPVSSVLYAIATLASVILLFVSGLETDLGLFIRYAVKGGIVGVSGVVFSFLSGAAVTTWFLGLPFMHPACLFMGTLSVATSIGITASLLSVKRKINSTEGTVILAAAVIDDILGIILLAVILGIANLGSGAPPSAWKVAGVAGQAILVWVVITAAGIRAAKPLARIMKGAFADRRTLSILAFGMALAMAGLFELLGLSMIIGAYVMGLILSNTDLSFVIQERLRGLREFLVPVFFAVSGMMMNFGAVADARVLGFGLLMTGVAVAAKLLGCGGPVLAMDFTLAGALRVGWGMVPRGEVALIIAGLGVSTGVLDESLFGVALIVTIGTTILAPPILNHYLDSPLPSLRHGVEETRRTVTEIHFRSYDLAEVAVGRFLHLMDHDGFLISRMEHGEELYQICKDSVQISLEVADDGMVRFITEPRNTVLFQTALHESLLQIENEFAALDEELKPNARAAAVVAAASISRPAFSLAPHLDETRVVMRIAGETKPAILHELVARLGRSADDTKALAAEVLEREASMSTGMQDGIALPHARSARVADSQVVVGLKPDGVDFASLDGKPARVILLVLSPKKGGVPHLQLLSALAARLHEEGVMASLLAAASPREVVRILGRPNGAKKATSPPA